MCPRKEIAKPFPKKVPCICDYSLLFVFIYRSYRIIIMTYWHNGGSVDLDGRLKMSKKKFRFFFREGCFETREILNT